MEDPPELAFIDAEGGKGATWLPRRMGLLRSLELGRACLETFQARPNSPPFTLGRKWNRTCFPQEADFKREG